MAGQPGCGKTTLLLSLAGALREAGRLVVFVDMELATAVHALGAAEMHLAVLAGILAEAEREHRVIPGEVVERRRRWLQGLTDDRDLPTEPAALAQRLLSFLSALRSDAGLRAELRSQVSKGGDKDPLSLVSPLLDALAEARPVLILDGLDKLPPEPAREYFLIKERKPMADAACAAILTVPLSVVYEPDFNVLRDGYLNAESAVLPALRLHSLVKADGSQLRKHSPEGLALLRRIVCERVKAAQVEAGLIEDEAIDLVIEGSGGNLRELARLMQASIVKAVVHEAPQVARSHVEEAIADQRESFGRVLEERFLPALRRVRDDYQLDNTDQIGKLLLYGLWVVEYRNGTVWYDLPLPVRRLLERRERKLA